jgi:hypothetical protein
MTNPDPWVLMEDNNPDARIHLYHHPATGSSACNSTSR